MRTDLIRQRFEDLVLVFPSEGHARAEVLGRNHSEDHISFSYISTDFHVPREAEIKLTAEGVQGLLFNDDLDSRHNTGSGADEGPGQTLPNATLKLRMGLFPGQLSEWRPTQFQLTG